MLKININFKNNKNVNKNDFNRKNKLKSRVNKFYIFRFIFSCKIIVYSIISLSFDI